MWPFKKKVKHIEPDPKMVEKLKKQEKELLTKEELEKSDAEFRDNSGFLITKVMSKFKKKEL